MAINILLVDDSAVMRAMLQRILGMTGVPLGRVFEAGDGESALATLKSEPVDLLMLDISMPVMRGDQMLELLRRDAQLAHLPVIVISSERSGERIAQVQRLGAHYISKPFLPEQLREIIFQATGIADECCTD
jgi:two-component system chemotaxis response regulator CheY